MSQITIKELDERVSALEAKLSQLMPSPQHEPTVRDWRKTLGMFTGDQPMREIFELGRQVREQDRENSSR